MTRQEIYTKIKDAWTQHGYNEIIIKLEDFTRGAATGLEGLTMTRYFFKNLKKENNPAFKLTEDLIISYFKECEKDGLKNDL